MNIGDITKLLNKKSTYLFVACNEDDVPIGYSLGILVGQNAIWFNSLAVLKEYQSTAAAKELFAIIETTCKQLERKVIILEIRKDNKALLRRYKNMNYEIWKEINNYYPDGCSALRMIKKTN